MRILRPVDPGNPEGDGETGTFPRPTWIASEERFYRLLRQTRGPAVVLFSAEWCGSCRRVRPLLARLARQRPALVVAEVDVDHCPDLADAYRIRVLPTVIRFEDGRAMTAAQSPRSYEGMLVSLGFELP